jgi:hypothetical protein
MSSVPAQSRWSRGLAATIVAWRRRARHVRPRRRPHPVFDEQTRRARVVALCDQRALAVADTDDFGVFRAVEQMKAGWLDQGQARELVAPAERRFRRDDAAPRMPNQMADHVRPAAAVGVVVDQPLHEGAILRERKIAHARLAVIGFGGGIEIGRQHAEAIAQSRHQLAPLPAVAETAVNEDDGRPLAVLLEETRAAVDGYGFH